MYVTPLLVKGKTHGRPTLATPFVRHGVPPVVGATDVATVVTVAAVVAVTMSMMIAGVVVTAAAAAVVAVVVVAG